jgi:hypothetical protein
VLLGEQQVRGRAEMLAAREQRGGVGQRELGRDLDQLLRHRVHDRPQRAHLAVDEEVHPALGDEVGGEVPGLAGGGVTQRGGVPPVLGGPDGGARVQRLDLVRELHAQLGAQQLGEQLVVAVPDAVLVERRREHAAVLEPGDHRVTVGAAGERIGHLGVERLDDRRAQEERAEVRRLVRERLADEVVADGHVGPGEAVDERARVGMVAQRDRGQPQRGRPSLGPPPELPEVLRRELDAEGLEHRRRLVACEREVRGPDRGEAALEPHAADRDGRVCSRDQDQPQARRREPGQALDVVADDVGHLVEVLEHQRHRPLAADHRLDQRGQDDLDLHGLARAHRQGGHGLVARRAGQRFEHGAPEVAAIGVVGVQ